MYRFIVSALTLFIILTGQIHAKGKKYDYVIKPYGSAADSSTSLKPSTKQKNYMKDQGYNYAPDNTYRPNLSFAPGIAVTIGKIGFSIGQLADTSKSDDENGYEIGKTKGTDYSLSWFNARHGISIFAQEYKGLHLGNPDDYGTPAELSADYPKSEKWSRKTNSLTYYYLLNDGGFSIPALLNQNEQLAAGFAYSLILSVGGSMNSLSGNGTPILHSTQQSFYEKSSDLETLQLQELNATFGLGVSQTLFDFYVALYVGVGPSQQEIKLSYLNSPAESESSLSYSGNGLFALGYGGDTFFVGMYMHYEASQSQSEELDFNFSRGSRETFIGIRF